MHIAQVTFVENPRPQLKISSFKTYQHSYIIQPLSDTAFKGVIVNRALPSLHEGSLEITLTVPLGTN